MPGEVATLGERSPPIDLSNFAFGDLRGELAKLIGKALTAHLNETHPYVSLPAAWGDSDGEGGPPVDDPLTLRVHIPFGEDDDSEPYWQVSLADIAESFLSDTRDDGSYSEGALRIAGALEELAKKIREDCATGENNWKERE